MRNAGAAGLCLVLLLVSGCDVTDPPRVHAPRPAGPTPTVTLPIPTPAEGNLHSGEAVVNVSAATRLTFRMQLDDPGMWREASGAILATWSDGEGNTLGLGGALREGRVPTSETLRITIALPGVGIYSSAKGECEVELTASEAAAVAGSFACARAPGGPGGHIDATGEFVATG